MAKKKKAKNGIKWKPLLLIILIGLCAGGYYVYSENKNINLPELPDNKEIQKTLKKTVQEADKIKDEIVAQAENLKPVIEKIRSGNKEETTTSAEAPKLNLEIPVYTYPGRYEKEIIINRTGYTLSYNLYYKNPNWVAWELTREETKGEADRYDKFMPDPNLPEPRVVHKDYTKSGYDRGHMAPAADMKWSKQAMIESFYMSNICPQVGNLNRGDWNDLEELCRNWAAKYGRIYIACGPIFDSKSPKRIGVHKVAVPDRFFKVILIYNRKNPIAMGFIFKNTAHSQDIEKYMVTVDSVENVTGMDFFSKLPDEIENRIESIVPKLPSRN
ncbi:DNA/RNA non-specific endonuclease [uncultured Bacteroides sp.]|uniref:DNA/RNA non-specific endonuclease n=1 Tax=uncultured Bacteroides sp. TaxID=162156 RepID=UPI002596999A|nr:DNA/RNA non-specific endonuclease [uncultured Bacteroides sp.]